MGGQDVKLSPDERGNYDLVVINGQLDFVEGLQTSVVVSLFADSRASSSIVPQADNRRGWVGDIIKSLEGKFTGSTLWTLDQARLTSETVSQAEIAAKDALAWMVEENIAQEVNVQVERSTRLINVNIEIVASNNTVERYNILWRKTNASGLSNI